MSKRTAEAELPEWERLLSAAARLQEIVPGAVLVGGTAAVLILRRNATRDYVDLAALGDGMGQFAAAAALNSFDDLYPQSSGESSLQQLCTQLASPLPYDLEQTDLSEYRHLEARWHQWEDVASVCRDIALNAFDSICAEGGGA